ncbi:MAG: glycerol-3-phosphate dehydrogenase/oxidase [Calditrichia bacterium]|nr:glycerol-3-phosphate dehydrogenase/oxidase [Calditrichia bacterium]
MNRKIMLDRIAEKGKEWDVIVIGGGATGLGTALEAASRGYKTLLLEQHDFCKGTSSRSTKLIHGGIRYLQQGNVSLVIEALKERGLLIQNAPHLVHHRSFVVPAYDWWSGPFYGIGLKIYDLMAGKLGLKPSRMLSHEDTLKHIPTLEPEELRGGIMYYDGQFDDSRLAINLAQTIDDQKGTVINYMPVTALLKKNGLVKGVVAVDSETGKEYQINTKAVVNATGIFTDQILKMDNPSAENLLTLSQGIHLVLDEEFLPGESAIMVPHTDDGRVLFAVPWNGKVLVGTTDTPIPAPTLEPQPMEEEVEFLLAHAARYLTKDPQLSDIRSIFVGIRPLVTPGDQTDTATISRDHYLLVSESGLVTITGGKWTTFRKMAEDTINQVLIVGDLPERESVSRKLKIHGWIAKQSKTDPLDYYGADAPRIREIMEKASETEEKIHPRLPYPRATVIWAVREEMARTVEDVLSRRTRSLLLDAKASEEAAPLVADLMANELGYSDAWKDEQIKSYRTLSASYLP